MDRRSIRRGWRVVALLSLGFGAVALWQRTSPDPASDRIAAPAGRAVLPPPAVLEAAERIDRHKEALRSAAGAGRKSLAATLEELRIEAAGLYPDSEEFIVYFANGLLGLATRSPAELRKFLEDTASPHREPILSEFLSVWDSETFDTPVEEPAPLLDTLRLLSEQAPAEVVAILDRLPEGDLRDVLAFEIAEAWSAHDPTAARTWIEAMPESTAKGMAVSAFAENWALEDVAGAAKWSLRQGDPESRIAGVGAVLAYWVRKSPDESIAWLETHIPAGSPAFAELAPLVAESWSIGADARVYSWIERLPSGDTRDEAARMAVLGGMESDPAATFIRLRDWAAGSSPAAPRLPGLAQLALADWARRDPLVAAGHLKTLPPSRFRDEAVFGFATGHADVDPESALEWALSISDTTLRDESLDLVVESWMEESRRAGALTDLEQFSRDLEVEGRLEESRLIRERSQAILFRGDEE